LGKALEKRGNIDESAKTIKEAVSIADKDEEWKKWFHKFDIKKYDEMKNENPPRIAWVKK
jgi:hypothetical protein